MQESLLKKFVIFMFSRTNNYVKCFGCFWQGLAPPSEEPMEGTWF